MNISPSDAQEALNVADDAVQQVKYAIDRQTSRIVLMWGIVYVLAPLFMHFWPVFGFIPQQMLLMGAIAFTIYDSKRNTMITGPNHSRIGFLWWVTFGFGWAWFLILEPATFQKITVNNQEIMPNGLAISRQMWAYGVSLAMFMYVVMGLWIGRIYVFTGLLVTIFTVIGLLFLGDWYWLWCSVTAGGTLVIAGLYIRRQNQS